MPDPTTTSVRLRLLPWRPRWRGRDVDDAGLGDLLSLGDDPISAVLGLLALLLLLPVVVAVLFGLAVLSLEVLVLLPLGLLLLAGRLCHLRPWVLVVHRSDGSRTLDRVYGLAAARRRRQALLRGV